MRKSLEIEGRGENINFGRGWEVLEAGTGFFNRIENTLISNGMAHNLTSIDDHESGWSCWKASITFNRA